MSIVDASDHNRRRLESYYEINAFTVRIDHSERLNTLIAEARALRPLSHHEKIEQLKKITGNSLRNAYELMVLGSVPDEQALGIDLVRRTHPLSYALEKGAGSCRYQGALFFVLGYEAELGDEHHLQVAFVNGEQCPNSVFNEVVHLGQRKSISLCAETLQRQELDFTRHNPFALRHPYTKIPGMTFYSYQKTGPDYEIFEEPERISTRPAFIGSRHKIHTLNK